MVTLSQELHMLSRGLLRPMGGAALLRGPSLLLKAAILS